MKQTNKMLPDLTSADPSIAFVDPWLLLLMLSTHLPHALKLMSSLDLGTESSCSLLAELVTHSSTSYCSYLIVSKLEPFFCCPFVCILASIFIYNAASLLQVLLPTLSCKSSPNIHLIKLINIH